MSVEAAAMGPYGLFTLEDEVESHIRAAFVQAFNKEPSAQWLRALSMRVGVCGPVAAYAEASEAVGVTRERVRQVANRLIPYLEGIELKRALPIAEQLAKHSPVREPIGTLLAPTGLSRPTLTGQGFLHLLQLTGSSTRQLIGIDLVAVEGWIVGQSEAAVMQSAAMARKHTSRYGMTTLALIGQDLASPERPLDPEGVARVLLTDCRIHWAGGWLWAESDDTSRRSNSLLNTVRQILAVNQPQTLASIREGVRRYFKSRDRDVVPPVEAMRVFLITRSDLTVSGDYVTSTPDLDYHHLLGPVAATVVDVLKTCEHQAVDRQSLTDMCAEAGVSPGSLAQWSTYAPWLDKVGRQVLALRGSNPPPAVIAELALRAKQRTSVEARRTQWTWHPNGALQLTVDVTTSMLSSGTFSAARGLPAVIAGASIKLTSHDRDLGYLKTSHSHPWVWGLTVALRAFNANVGDVLTITIDLATSTAAAELETS